MSGHYPGYPGGPPPYGPPPPWGHHPPPPHHYPPPPPHYYPPPPDGGQVSAYPPPPDGGQVTAAAYPGYYYPTMMIPVPMAPMPQPAPAQPDSQPTYVTNYIYHGQTENQNQVSVVETSGDFDWLPITAMTANTLTGRAVVGGHEGWDGSPLWVIRAWHSGDLIPGKLSIRHNAASIMYDGKEISKQNIEVLCAAPENLRWVPASNGNVPPGAIPGGRTTSGETLYVGRARYQLSITPGKVHPSHNACYIGFGGQEVAHKMYDVLCRIS
ncbi:Farnesoic acid O-methyltransferase [Operophtera brumata]|uniref:Farnesoic acid O-methyltransferase n=1 Tax=Operophtera brumata TaxID=104452 RepID=A0A0L7L0Q0_OPEBR|nr:Farnesoic acid O-methyltransferase [Operophtera brumata]